MIKSWKAHRSFRWLCREWLPAYALLPGANRDPHPDHRWGAQECANLALSGDAVFVHHRDRMNADPDLKAMHERLWGVAMRCARGAAAHDLSNGGNGVGVLIEARELVRKRAGRLDVPEDPFKDALP